jgi:hypothetical protein
MKLKCRIISTIMASKGLEEKLPPWISRHIARCTCCEAEARAYEKLGNALKAQQAKQECSLKLDDMMASLQALPDNKPFIRRKAALSFAAACTFIIIAAAGMLLTSQSGLNKHSGSGSKPDTVARQPMPDQQEERAFTETPQISLIGPDCNSAKQVKDAAPPEKRAIEKYETQSAEKLVVASNNRHSVKGPRTYKPQHMPVHVDKQNMPDRKQKTVDTPGPKVIEQAPETDINVARIKPDPILVVPEDRVIEVIQDDRNFDTRCSYEIQLVNTDSSGHAVPL